MEALFESNRELLGGKKDWEFRLLNRKSDDKEETVRGKPVEGVRRFVIATNIAEMSLTIPNVGIVLDTFRRMLPV